MCIRDRGDQAAVRVAEQHHRRRRARQLARSVEHRGEVGEVRRESIDVAALPGRLAVAADVVGQRGPARIDDHVRDLVVAAAVLGVAMCDEDCSVRRARGLKRLGVQPRDGLCRCWGDRTWGVVHERLLYRSADRLVSCPAMKDLRTVDSMWRKTLGLLAICAMAGCLQRDDRELAKSATRLDLAKDFLRKHQLEAADTECNRALAFNPANDEAYNIRGLVAMVRALDTQRMLEIDACLTGLDADVSQRDLDGFLRKADGDFAAAARLSPDYGEAWSNRGVVHNLLEDYANAATYLTEALSNPMRLDSPGLTRAHLGL